MRRLKAWLSGLGRIPVLVAGLLVGAAMAVAVPVWGLVASPSAVSTQLGYSPVTPCVVVDTRLAGPGPFVAPTARAYDVTPANGNFSSQGGSATGCDVPEGVAAVFFNLKTEWRSGVGRVEVYAHGTPQTGAPIVNFDPSSFKDNAGATTTLCQGTSCGADFVVNVPGQTGASTHVIVTVLGYFSEALERTIVVNGGGTDSENGNALREALAAIPTIGPEAPSTSNPWLIELEPGTFDIGTLSVTIGRDVHVRGSGRAATTITCDCLFNTIYAVGTTRLVDLAVVNTGTGTWADGIYNVVDGVLEVTRSNVRTAGDDGIHNRSGGTATVVDSHIVTTGSGPDSEGIFNRGTMTIRDTIVETTSPGTTADGIFNDAAGMVEVTDSYVTTTADDGIVNLGTATVHNSQIESTSTVSSADGIGNGSGAVLELVGCSVEAAGDDGVDNSGTATIRQSRIEATGTGTSDHGIANGSGATMSLHGSTVDSNTADGISNLGSVTVFDSTVTGASQGIISIGTATTINSWVVGGTDGIQNAGGTVAVISSRVSATTGAAVGNIGGTGATTRIETSSLRSSDAVFNASGNTMNVVGSHLSGTVEGVDNRGNLILSDSAIDAPDHVANTGTGSCAGVTYVDTTFHAVGCP